ncbi:MAG: restriction endonuclease [Armatimonadetes bacterium]|nr:restriction endonuclease [Armatimonadota bacterium]
MPLICRNEPQAHVLRPSPAAGRVIDRGSVALRLATLPTDEWAAPALPPWSHQTPDGFERPAPNKPEAVPDVPPLAQRLSLVLQPPLSLCMSSTGPLEWPGDLLDFQKTGIHVLVERPSVLLADDMGLGKTIQAASAMRLLARRREIEKILVVVPAAVVRNWRVELGKWAPELRVLEITGAQSQRAWKWDARVHVKIVSYDTLRSDYPRVSKRCGDWDLICLDEAQRVKNRESAISGAVKKLASNRRWALTGTPLENSLDDVRSILDFLNPGEEVREGDIRSALERVQLRRKKTEVLSDLPPKMVNELFVPLTREQREEYDRALSGGVVELRDKGENVTVTDVLALINRLKQVCNFATRTGRSSKLEDVGARLRALRLEGHKALVFSQFTSESYGVRRLARALAAFGPVIYTGDMSAGQRLAALETFQKDPDVGVLILSLKAGGVGLNLQRASYVFHFDRWWNPASETQAEDRSHRVGQTRGVSVYKYICEDTIEERIHEILRSKKDLFAEYVDDVCMDLGQRLTEEELFGLFNLEPPKKKRPQVSDVSLRELSGPELEILVKYRLEQYGYEVSATSGSHDGGIDLVAVRVDELGLETTLLVQCKNWSSPVGVQVVREMNGVLPRDGRMVRGLIVCPAGFTADAAQFAEKHHILLWTASEPTGL